MPSMTNLRFQRAVIFMCAHDDKGAMGLMINQRMPNVRFGELLKQLKIDHDADQEPLEIPIMNGGPVESARGFILHGRDYQQKDTVDVNGEYGVTGTIEAIRQVVKGNGPDEMLFILGYAGWSAGQLDGELQKNAWLTVDADPEIIFHDNPDDKWDLAIGKLGIDPSMLSAIGGNA